MKKFFNLRTLIVMALLASLGAVFSAVGSIEIPYGGVKIVEISLTPIPVMLAGILFGPLAGGLVGFVADTAGFFMGVQHSAYNPIFSVTMALFGVIAGVFYLRNKKNNVWKAIGASVTGQIVCSITLNTWAIWFFYSVPIQVLIPPRVISAVVEMPIYVVLIMLLIKAISPIVSRQKRNQIA